jgi:hypothetical protein
MAVSARAMDRNRVMLQLHGAAQAASRRQLRRSTQAAARTGGSISTRGGCVARRESAAARRLVTSARRRGRAVNRSEIWRHRDNAAASDLSAGDCRHQRHNRCRAHAAQ